MIQLILQLHFRYYHVWSLGGFKDQREHGHVIPVGFAGPDAPFVVQEYFDVLILACFDPVQTRSWYIATVSHCILDLLELRVASVDLFILDFCCAHFF